MGTHEQQKTRKRFGSSWKSVWFLAFKDVTKDKRMVALVVTILAVSYVNIVFMSSFMNGLAMTFEDQLVDLMTSHVMISPKENTKYIDDVSVIERKVNLVPGVLASAPRINDGGTISYKSKTIPVPIIAITPSKEEDVSILAIKVVGGEFLSDSDTRYVLLGKTIASSESAEMSEGLGVDIGNKVRVSYSNGVAREYIVKGIIFANFFGADETIYVTTKEIESVYSRTDWASSILIRTDDKKKSDQYKNLIMAENVGGTVKTWKEYAGFIEDLTSSLDMLSAVTAFVGLLVAAMTMAVIIFINTTHKRRQIGILKAIGTKDSVILRIYLLEAAMLGILGIAAGLVMGNALIYYFNMNPLTMPMGDVRPYLESEQAVTAAILLLFAVVAAGFYPAWKAANENILKAILGE